MTEKLNVAPGLAFLFDMDGVLIESTAIHTEAWNVYLKRHGIDPDGVMQKMLGKRNDQIVRMLWGGLINDDEVSRHGADKERLYREMMAPVFQRHVVGGVVNFVRQARGAGVKCALATNAEPANVRFVLEGTDLVGMFDAVVDGHHVRQPKPEPEVFLKAAEMMGVLPRNTVIFEDSPGGLAAARAAGGHVVAVLTTLSEAPQADFTIGDFEDPALPSWLSRLTVR